MKRCPVDPDEPVRSYWQRRLHQHHEDTYRGIPLVKLPEDLRAYQHVIEEVQPDSIIELGTARGGSALWFADQMTVMFGRGRVITIDVSLVDIPDDRITFIHGNALDVVDKVALAMYEHGLERPLVVEDSSHTFDNTLAALRAYETFVPVGSYFVVEDTIVDTDLSVWPKTTGAGKAVKAFLQENDRFEPVPADLYGITMHMGGWLKAVR